MVIRQAPKELLEREGITQRQWKARKRKELKEIQAALRKFLKGLYYTPCRDYFVVDDKLNEWQQAMSIKNWGK